jgi:hypothetical protein
LAEIVAAVDEQTANQILDTGLAALPPQTFSGSSSLGPFAASYAVTGTLAGGDVDLIAPATVRIADLRLNWHLSLTLSVDLGDFLPEIHIPQICVDIPCVGKVCTPKIDITWPTISIPVSFGDFLKTTLDLGLLATLDGTDWVVQAQVQGVPSLSFGLPTAAILAAVGAAAAAVLAPIPFIGPFLAIAVSAILAAIGVAGLTGLLGPILSLFLAGRTFDIQRVPATLEILPYAGPNDPAAHLHLDAVSAEIQHNAPEDELVVLADVSAA